MQPIGRREKVAPPGRAPLPVPQRAWARAGRALVAVLLLLLLLLCGGYGSARPVVAGLYTCQNGYMIDAPLYVPVIECGANLRINVDVRVGHLLSSGDGKVAVDVCKRGLLEAIATQFAIIAQHMVRSVPRRPIPHVIARVGHEKGWRKGRAFRRRSRWLCLADAQATQLHHSSAHETQNTS